MAAGEGSRGTRSRKRANPNQLCLAHCRWCCDICHTAVPMPLPLLPSAAAHVTCSLGTCWPLTTEKGKFLKRMKDWGRRGWGPGGR